MRLKPLKESISHVSLRQHTPNMSCSPELEIFYQLAYKQLTPTDQGQSSTVQSLRVRRHERGGEAESAQAIILQLYRGWGLCNTDKLHYL